MVSLNRRERNREAQADSDTVSPTRRTNSSTTLRSDADVGNLLGANLRVGGFEKSRIWSNCASVCNQNSRWCEVVHVSFA